MSIRNRLIAFSSSLIAALALAVPAFASEISVDTVILVAKPALKHRLYRASILIAKPMSGGRHVGFIINKPTEYTLGKLFPEHEPSQKVSDPIFLGGPVSTGIIFAMVQREESPGGRSMQLAPGLFLASEREVVDRIIEDEPQRARFYAGFVIWRPGELDAEVKQGMWYVRDVDNELMRRPSTEGLWEELLKRSQVESDKI
jgi:putative transcriptional regulator